MSRSSLAVVAGLWVASGCKPPQQTDLPICLSEVVGDEAVEAQTGQLPPEVWFQVLLRNYNRKTGLVAEPVRDCSGKEVQAQRTPEQQACLNGQEPPVALPARGLTPDDLVIVPTENDRSLVWVQARHFANGDALGPIAITQWTARGIAVRAVGALHAHANRARLRLEPMGTGSALVVESDVCDPDDPKKCERVMRIVPIDGDRFVELPLTLGDGACVGPAEFQLHRERTIILDNGDERQFELTRTVDFTDGVAVMSESVVIRDRDPKEPDTPAAVFRNATVRRTLTRTPTAIVTTPGLWEKMVAEHGSVALAREGERSRGPGKPAG